jgi:hypothetical protein
MNITLLTSLILTGTLFLLGNQAHANPEAGFNESESQPAIDIVSTDNLSPTILRQVTIMCPRSLSDIPNGNKVRWIILLEGPRDEQSIYPHRA